MCNKVTQYPRLRILFLIQISFLLSCTLRISLQSIFVSQKLLKYTQTEDWLHKRRRELEQYFYTFIFRLCFCFSTKTLLLYETDAFILSCICHCLRTKVYERKKNNKSYKRIGSLFAVMCTLHA